MTDLTDKSIATLIDGLREKKFSSLEVTESYLKKIEREEHLNAYIHVAQDEYGEFSAREHAKRADIRLKNGETAPLLGIPLAIKDLILTKGVHTTAASKMLENFIPPYNATVYDRLLKSGAFALGKANLDEFAMGSSNENSAFGPVKNPWNHACVPGGTSGGSAAAVAAHICPGSLGTDTGGSIRQPASFCGVAGIKPTYGRVSRYGVVAYASSLDQVGPIARDVRDCAILLNAIAGHDPLDSTSDPRPAPDFTASLGKDIRGLKIGIPKEYFIDGMAKDVEGSVRTAIRKLEELGAIPVEITLPHTEAAVATYYIIAPAEASSNLARYDGVRFGHRAKEVTSLHDLYIRSRSEGFGKEVKRRIIIGTYVLSSGYYEAYYGKAQRVRSLVAQDFRQVFEKECDVIVCPTAPTTAYEIGAKVNDPIEMYLGDIFTIPVNLAGLPAMSIPCGFDSSGLPIGLQLIGKHWDEEQLLRIAHAYESATEWHLKTPTSSNDHGI